MPETDYNSRWGTANGELHSENKKKSKKIAHKMLSIKLIVSPRYLFRPCLNEWLKACDEPQGCPDDDHLPLCLMGFFVGFGMIKCTQWSFGHDYDDNDVCLVLVQINFEKLFCLSFESFFLNDCLQQIVCLSREC